MSAADWDALMGRLLFAGWLLFALVLGWLAAGEPPKKYEEDDRR